MFTVRVTFWVIILLTILSSLLDGSGEFDIKLTKIENGNSTIENAVSEINIDNQKHQFSPNALNNEIPLEFKEQKEKRKVPESITEIHSSFGETLSLNTDFKSEIIHRKGTNAAPSVSQVDVSNRVSELRQAAVFTLVDSAALELRERASPALLHPAGDAAAFTNLSLDGAQRIAFAAPSFGVVLPSAVPNAASVAVSDAAFHAAPDAAPSAASDGSSEAASDAPDVVSGPSDEALIAIASEQAIANGTELQQERNHYVVRAEPKQLNMKEESNGGAAQSAVAREGDSVDAVQSAAQSDGPTPTPAEGASNASSEEAAAAAAAADDIPSFNEWAQRQLAEAEEKKKVLNGSSGGSGGSLGPRPVMGSASDGGGGAGGAGGGGSVAVADRSAEGKALKLRSKNYASPDCGAKIVAANPEAVSPGAILSASRDEYMLNTCITRIWFVVELCEAIQAKKVELANFELFSSSPHEFAVSVSDRVQGREWRRVGHFFASEDRSVQSFALHPHLFGRYVKVEVNSHHGSEHFCPLSLFRVYGTSEFEVLEKVDEAADEDEDEELAANGGGRLGLDDEDDEGSGSDDEDNDAPLSPGEPPRNLFESYKNAVLSIVKQAAQALTQTGEGSNETLQVAHQLDVMGSNATVELPSSMEQLSRESDRSSGGGRLCKSPRHLVVCDNCSDSLYSDVFALLSCRERDLEVLMASAFVAESLRESSVCARYGLNFARRRSGAPFPLRAAADAARADPGDYFTALFPAEYVAALCNLLAINERRVALNMSDASNATIFAQSSAALVRTPAQPTSPLEDGLEKALPPITCTLETPGSTQSPVACSGGGVLPVAAKPSLFGADLASQIKPTKTLVKEDGSEDTAIPVGPPLQGSEAPVMLATEARLAATVVKAEETVAPSPGSPPAAAAVAANATPSTSQTPAPPSDPALLEEREGRAAADVPLPELTSVEPEVSEGDSTTTSSEDNFDSLLRDLKNLEQNTDGTNDIAIAGTPPPPTSATPPSTAHSAVVPNIPPPAVKGIQSQTQSVQKDSVFVRLANRIKALERNMSLSGQYLEELSRRYKKQVEEMQKAFNRTLQAVHEAGRIGEEREVNRREEIWHLQQQLLHLSELVENLIGERNSWFNRTIIVAQHLLLIAVEITVFVIMMYFCRRIPPTAEERASVEIKRKVSGGMKNKRGTRLSVKRRKSVEGVSGHESPRIRNRRPSEEALNIVGSYQDLLITDPGITDVDGRSTQEHGYVKLDSRRRRRKKKDTILRSASVRLPVRSTKPLINVTEEQINVPGRRASSLELGVWWASSNGVKKLNDSIEAQPDMLNSVKPSVSVSECYASIRSFPLIVKSGSSYSSSTEVPNLQIDSAQKQGNTSHCSANDSIITSLSETVPSLTQNNGLVNSYINDKIQQQLSTPVFMRTATSVRKSRLSNFSVQPSPPAKLKSDNWEWYSTHHAVDNSSQPKVSCSVSCPVSFQGKTNLRQDRDDADTNETSSTSSTSNISEGIARKESKKGSSSLKKMVKKFF